MERGKEGMYGYNQWYRMVIDALERLHSIQMQVHGLQARCLHSATAFSLHPGVMEVTLFGGVHKWPSIPQYSDADIPPISNTTVIRFGESSANS